MSNFMGMGVFRQKEQKIPGAHKIGTAISGPRIVGGKLQDITLFLKKKPLLWVRGNLGGILSDTLGEGNCESKIAARQWGVNFRREASRCLPRPSGKLPSFANHYTHDIVIFELLFRGLQ